MGDHALVISFQPFRGQWVQAIACFLTHSNATADELTKLLLEAVILLERSNLFVDGVVTDGASWNRSMWINFGVTKEKPSAEHPCDPQRRLWFISDFPHLLKCMRNAVCSKKIIKTPKGDVKLDHWEAIIEANELHQVGLRQCHKLTRDHINPDPWQKVRVGMAFQVPETEINYYLLLESKPEMSVMSHFDFQFWSASVAASMSCLRFQDCSKLDDCDASIEMRELINKLSDAMNSNRPANAMRLNTSQYQDIQNFLDYFVSLKKWDDDRLLEKLVIGEKARVANLRAKGKRPREKSRDALRQEDYIFSDSTDIGLIVTLKGTLELVKFLVEKCNFQFVMTARLNQDALERFFGLVRQSCGGNTHPEPRVFAQLFRLLSVYSLVKPMRGSNITGGNMVTTLLNLDDLKSKTKQERQKAFTDKLDELVINGIHLDEIPDIIESFNHDHNYVLGGESIDEFALSYVAGFVSRHSTRYIKDCVECEKCIKKTESEKTEVDMLITMKSKGWLTYATDALINLLRVIEQSLLQASLQSEMEENFIFVVLD
ncbi:Transposable element P transposase, partial [Frankliniella fusca]